MKTFENVMKLIGKNVYLVELTHAEIHYLLNLLKPEITSEVIRAMDLNEKLFNAKEPE